MNFFRLEGYSYVACRVKKSDALTTSARLSYKSTVTFSKCRERARNRAKGIKYASGC